MFSTLNLEEKYNKVRRNFCFYLDIQDNGLARSLSRRLQDLGLQQEVFLTSRVTHVVSDGAGAGAGAAGALPPRCNGARTRADAMLERARTYERPHPHLVQLTVQKAISLLDKLYDTFFAAPRRAHVKLFSKHYIKIEFLDKVCRPVFKEFDEWPEFSIDPDPPKDKKEKKESTTTNNQATNDINQNQQTTAGQKMTRKSRPRIKEKEEKEPKGGHCEMCNTDYADATLHRRSPHHLAFVRDHTNFLALDSLIASGADVATFLDKATPINGERRSLRKMCNGEVEQPKSTRSKRSQSPDSTVNGSTSPKRNGALDDDKKRNTRCTKKSTEVEDRRYYKVVGVSTKLRSSGGFTAKRKESPPTCNGTKPLVVKFRQVRRSELSVLSDEAEQFMFPKRASSTSSTSSDEDDKEEVLTPRRKTPTQLPPASMERRRLARPVALKEESSEEDGWPEDTKRRKRRSHAPVKRGRRLPLKPPPVEPSPEPEQAKPEPGPAPPQETRPVEEPEPTPEVAISPLREEPVEKCMKWEDGKLTYTPAVEQLEFAFESVPKSEPWFETFKRQDEDKVLTKNVPEFFALYSKPPKLPYEIGQLPPLKPNCCPLSDLVRRDDKAGPSRSYGTRGMKKQKIRKRTAAILALEGHPRKSPREHASTLAILGSAGLLHRRKNGDDAKSTASEDTISDTQSNAKTEPLVSEVQEASDRLQQFFSEVFEDAAEYEVSEEAMEGDAAVTTSTNAPDMSSLVSECDDCDIIRNEIKEGAEARARGRRGKFKKKNRTGWPNKKKSKKGSRTNSSESQKGESLASSTEPTDEETTQDAISEEDPNLSEAENEKTLIQLKEEEESKVKLKSEATEADDGGSSPRKRKSQEKSEATETEDSGSSPRKRKSQEKSEATETEDSGSSLRKLKSQEKSEATETEDSGSSPRKLKSQEKSEATETEDGGSSPRKSKSQEKRMSHSSSDTDEKEDRRKKKRALAGLLLQPVVRVARVDPNAARRLRSADKQRSSRLR